jgi:hypothetical protein
MGFGSAVPQDLEESLQRRQRSSLYAVHLVSPVSELAVEMRWPVVEPGQTDGVDVDEVDRRELVGHALAHLADPVGCGVRRIHLVDVASHAFHDDEGAPEHVTRGLEP